MEKVKTVVLLPCDEAQRKLFEEAGGERCEFIYVDPNRTERERLLFFKDAEIIIGEPDIREIQECPYLKWIQMSSAGTDIYTLRDGFPQGVILTNAKGGFGVVIPEFIIAVLLELCRNLKAYAINQTKRSWHQLGAETLLAGKRALILGAGDIGTGTARRLKAFGMHVTGMRRTDRNYPGCYDDMITTEQLDKALLEADIVIGCLPGTKDTIGLLNARRLRLMKRDAFLINVGRGTLIDTDELAAVLHEGHLGGVALDVTDPEPLPTEHPLWGIDRVVITPHVAGPRFGFSKDTENRIIRICCQNLKRYLEGKELVNQVDFETGYVSG